jgi:tyrosyl-tRNA synthetase
MASKAELIQSLMSRGVENIIPSRDELLKLLESDKKLKVYLGVDPTATRIHLGHAFPLRKLQIMLDLGHEVSFLIGDFTALIGDTSDKDTERPMLTREQIEENFATYQKQAEKLLDFSKVRLVYNSEWLSKLGFGEILKIANYFSLNDFISRELIRNRLKDGKRVSLPETLYPLMQGYDAVMLDTDIQFGGTDQTFNMQAGRSLLKQMKNKESCVVANGFLTGTDGRKMSKSWGNAIWLSDSAEEIYGKVMSIADELIVEYFTMGTNVSEDKINEVKERLSGSENPMSLKRELAREIIRELCGEDQVSVGEDHFQKTVIEKEAGEDAVEIEFVGSMLGSPSLCEVSVNMSLVESTSEFKRLLDEGAVYFDEKRLTRDSVIDKPGTVRVGKRKYLKLK